MAEKPTSSSTTYTTLGAPSGALGGSKGDQSGTESRMSTLIVPLNGVMDRSLPPPSRRRIIPFGGCAVAARPRASGHVFRNRRAPHHIRVRRGGQGRPARVPAVRPHRLDGSL